MLAAYNMALSDWDYVNNRLGMEKERLRCKLEYLERMEQEIVAPSRVSNGFGVIKI